jgi:hypothetical protein
MALRVHQLGPALSVPNLRGGNSDDPLNFDRKIDSWVNADSHLESFYRHHNHPSTRNARSICAVAISTSDLFLVCAAFSCSSAAKSPMRSRLAARHDDRSVIVTPPAHSRHGPLPVRPLFECISNDLPHLRSNHPDVILRGV